MRSEENKLNIAGILYYKNCNELTSGTTAEELKCCNGDDVSACNGYPPV
jgi:hypothetical protein